MKTVTIEARIYEPGDDLIGLDLQVKGGAAKVNASLVAFQWEGEALLIPVGSAPAAITLTGAKKVAITSPIGARSWSIWMRRKPLSWWQTSWIRRLLTGKERTLTTAK